MLIAKVQRTVISYIILQKKNIRWLLELVFDYGEHTPSTGHPAIPSYLENQPWLLRADSFSDYACGFEIRMHRLCRHILMFHHFDELGKEPTLVKALHLRYQETPILSQLQSVQSFGYRFADNKTVHSECLPPITFQYTNFSTAINPENWQHWHLPSIFHEGPYQLVDLYGEGIPGILYSEGQSHYYCAPQRADVKKQSTNTHSDAVSYGKAWSLLDSIPVGGLGNTSHTTLMDITGDGQLDYIVTREGWNGFFPLNENQQFQSFIPFDAFPCEFLHPDKQLIDIRGSGLMDLVLMGPQSVRIYPNQRYHGFGRAQETAYSTTETLPSFHTSESELVAFSHLLGSSTQHLVRIQANQITCWPHLGHGRFGAAISWATLPFTAHEFDPKRLYLADLDGSGATDIIYAYVDHLQIFPNHSGNGLGKPYNLAFPPGVCYDTLTHISFADIRGQGVHCLVLTQSHPLTQHWIYDFSQGKKPYLLQQINNNCGLCIRLQFRSSSQEWLDEKQENPQAHSGLAFPVHVLTRMQQIDEISSNQLIQNKQYRQSFYDRQEREFNGFGLVISQDTETFDEKQHPSYCAPLCIKTWYYIGRPENENDRLAYYQADAQAKSLATTLYVDNKDKLLGELSTEQQQKINQCLRGMIRRQETYGLDHSKQRAHPYEVSESRYKVRLIQEAQPYSVYLVSPLEQLNYYYERVAQDPRCTHEITLAQDAYGFVQHQLSVSYPRRTPLPEPLAYQDEQQCYLRCSEKRSQWIHLTDPDTYHLGLVAEEKSWEYGFTLSLLTEKNWLSGHIFSYEQLTQNNTWLVSTPARQLSQWHRYYYWDTQQAAALALGQTTLQGLLSHTLTADISTEQLHTLEEHYGDQVKLKNLLIEKGRYIFAEDYYWIPSLSAHYAPSNVFYQLEKHSHLFGGETSYRYDRYHFNLVQLNDAVGNQTQFEYDYRHLQIQKTIDCNDNTRALVFDALGRVILSTFYADAIKPLATSINKKTAILSEPIGFAALDTTKNYFFHLNLSQALENPKNAIQHWAEVYYYETFSWIEKHVPTHSLKLLSDRYPNDAARQIRSQLNYFDGLGRLIAEIQQADPGLAYQTDKGRVEKLANYFFRKKT
jgi:insecticidal toxin complex protein TccC